MDEAIVWETLIRKASLKPIELKTKTGLNFHLVKKGGNLVVKKSTIQPSAKVSVSRPIKKNDIFNVYPYYKRWVANEKGVRSEMQKITYHSSYLLAAIDYVVNIKSS